MMETSSVEWEKTDQPPRLHNDESDVLQPIVEFSNRPGQVLLIRGAPGTGKTALCLELLRRMTGFRKVYSSSRVSPTKLRKQLPWIDLVVDPVSGKSSGLVLEPMSEKAATQNELVGLTRSETDYIVYGITSLMRVRSRTVVAVDSWEGAFKGDKPGRALESAVLPGLSESLMNLILVSDEGGDVDTLENSAGGVIRLFKSDIEGRCVRMMVVEKLRGFRVPLKRRLFSLDGGRFTTLASEGFEAPSGNTRQLPAVKHAPGMYSMGSQDLDNLLGNGVKKGSFLLLETNETVSPAQPSLFLATLVCNFVNQGGCTFMLPYSTFSSKGVIETIRPYVDENALEERVRIGEYDARLPPAEYRVPLTGKVHADVRKFQGTWSALGGELSPKLLTMDFDLLEATYGEEMRLFTLQQMRATRDESALLVGLASNRNRILDELRRAADYHLMMSRLEDSLCLYGVKPLTAVSGLAFSFANGFPSMNLVQVS